jgi:uncharacterized ferredoxin-like protein
MIITSSTAETDAVMQAANAVCAAARTAPKACGFDFIDSAIVTGEDKDKIAAEMRRIGESLGERGAFFLRDAGNVDEARALVLIGATYDVRRLGKLCSLCGFDGCTKCTEAGAACVFVGIDLGIALGSAAAMLADLRIDNRILFTAGKAAAGLGYLGEHKMIMGIPLSVSCKNPFFDR